MDHISRLSPSTNADSTKAEQSSCCNNGNHCILYNIIHGSVASIIAHSNVPCGSTIIPRSILLRVTPEIPCTIFLRAFIYAPIPIVGLVVRRAIIPVTACLFAKRPLSTPIATVWGMTTICNTLHPTYCVGFNFFFPSEATYFKDENDCEEKPWRHLASTSYQVKELLSTLKADIWD